MKTRFLLILMGLLGLSTGLFATQAIHTPPIFQNPFMSPNNFSEIHNNCYQTDTFSVKGPGRSKHTTVQEALLDPAIGIGATLAFNSRGQIVSIRTSINSDEEMANTLLLIDSKTLKVIAQADLPSRNDTTSGRTIPGAYFYLDNNDQAVCVTDNQQIQIYASQDGQWMLVSTFDLSSTIGNPNDSVNSVLPDNSGNFWFITQQALVGYVQPNGQTFITSIRMVPGAIMTEINTKSFATDESGGVYVLTDYALYRFQVGPQGIPVATWRSAYDRGTRIKPGQNQQGSGTTPTLFNDFNGNKFITIADNADPLMNVLVFSRDTGKLVAQQAVFEKLPFRNACENSLIAVNHSILIENNFGNVNLSSTSGQKTTEPGLARVDFDPTTGQSKVVWENDNISIPSVVSGLSTKDGLIYTYAKDKKGWYFAAIDFHSGKIIAKTYVPEHGILTGVLANNFYSGLNVGPNGSAYVGIVGGILAWRKK